MTGHLVGLGQSYPVGWKLYRRQGSCEAAGVAFASKPELAQGFQLISAVKSNRKFNRDDKDLQVTQWQQDVPEEAFDLETVNASSYQSWSAIGRLSSRHSVKLVMNRVVGQERWRYLISTDLTLSAQTIPNWIHGALILGRVYYRASKEPFAGILLALPC